MMHATLPQGDCLTNSCGVGPPSPEVGSPFEKNSSAVDRSHIWVAPQACPVNMNLIPGI